MDYSKIMVFAMLLCSHIQHSELFPLHGSQSYDTNMRKDHIAEGEFMVANGVTQNEIEEFHYTNGYATPSIANGVDLQQGQGRSIGQAVEALKFWNWSAFENFRIWIEERRQRTTTLKPIPVYIVSNPHEPSPYNDIHASHPSYFK